MFGFLFCFFISATAALPLQFSSHNFTGDAVYDIKWLDASPSPSYLVLGEALGFGAFGTVYTVDGRNDIVAKVMDTHCPTLSREISITSKLEALVGVASLDEHETVLLLKRCPGNRLDDCVLDNVEEIEAVFQKASESLSCIHAKNVVHKDIHGKNSTYHLYRLIVTNPQQFCTTRKVVK